MLKPLRLITVGKIKNPFWKAAVDHYAERLGHWRGLTMTEVKDSDASLPIPQRKAQEARGILAALGARDIPLCLDEHGEAFTSRAFSHLLEKFSSNAGNRPCFIIGGPYGLDPAVLAASRFTIALGPLTLPHELARVVLLEQLYRAEAISRNVPYHHD